jgi:predicted 3-demethylubiquinone-9 3-methyltransferase (glyoxalase superfamily)
MSRITSFLWFDTQAEEAAHFYVSLFKKSKVGELMADATRHTGSGRRPGINGLPAGARSRRPGGWL